MTGPGGDPTPRRPAQLSATALNSAGTSSTHEDPAARLEAAHATAAAVISRLADGSDPYASARMSAAIDTDDGLDAAARLWAVAAPVSLPGALWRLVALRAGVRRDPVQSARDFDAGRAHVPVSEVVAGVGDPPGPTEVLTMVDAVLRGVGGVDFDATLERAAAFARVVAVGRSFRADDEDASLAGRSIQAGPDGGAAHGLGHGLEPGRSLTRSAAALVTTAGHLEAAARRWRSGELA